MAAVHSVTQQMDDAMNDGALGPWINSCIRPLYLSIANMLHAFAKIFEHTLAEWGSTSTLTQVNKHMPAEAWKTGLLLGAYTRKNDKKN